MAIAIGGVGGWTCGEEVRLVLGHLLPDLELDACEVLGFLRANRPQSHMPAQQTAASDLHIAGHEADQEGNKRLQGTWTISQKRKKR
eukprot:2987667-Rhodomonas_salina.4